MHETLRRDLALGCFPLAARKIGDHHALAPEEGRTDPLEMFDLHLALALSDDEDALSDFLGGIVGGAKQRVEAGHQRLDVGRENAAWVDVGQQMLHGQQGMHFGRVEPQARKLVLSADVGRNLVEAVAAGIPVPDDRCVEAVAHVL